MTIEHINNTEKAQQLTNAFRVFNELSEQLAVSYHSLEEQVAKLHQELAFAQSERLKSLEDKEKLASRLEKILAALPAGVVVLDADGKILECNAIAVTFLGEPLLAQTWADIVARSFQPMFANPHERLLANGARLNISYRQLEHKAGQIIVLSDVSEMRALQELLNQQKQMSAMGEMAASMAHQVRTPLATALLYASQMSNSTIDNETRQRFSEKILERLRYLERQVDDMLIFAKCGHLDMSTFSLSELLDHVQVGIKEYARQSRIKVQIINNVTQDELLGNANALRGALLNVVNNAVDALGQEGSIQITANLLDENLHIVIKDNGPGISEQHCQRVFEPFFTTKSNGTGLGLAVVDSVVKAHGGAVVVTSKPGLGTAFAITLPCLKPTLTQLPSGFSSKQNQ